MDAAARAPSNAALAGRVAGRVNLIVTQELTAAYFQSLIPTLQNAGNAVASATPGTILSALNGLNTALCSLGTLLNQANSSSTALALRPAQSLLDQNLAVGPNQSAQWTVSITNSSTVLHTYNLTASGLPSGVTAQFSAPSATVPPFGSGLNSSTAVTLTLTTGASFTTPFSFNVIATPQDAPEFAVAAAGTLLARPQSINLDQVTATPAYANAGTPVTISARVFSVVNEPVQAQLLLTLTDPNGHGVCCGQQSSFFTLTPSTSIQTITFSPIDTTNFINGVYQFSVVASAGGLPGELRRDRLVPHWRAAFRDSHGDAIDRNAGGQHRAGEAHDHS